MKRLVAARTLLAIVGVVVWGYGYRADDPNIRVAAIGILAVTLLLRYVPRKWLGGDDGGSLSG